MNSKNGQVCSTDVRKHTGARATSTARSARRQKVPHALHARLAHPTPPPAAATCCCSSHTQPQSGAPGPLARHPAPPAPAGPRRRLRAIGVKGHVLHIASLPRPGLLRCSLLQHGSNNNRADSWVSVCGGGSRGAPGPGPSPLPPPAAWQQHAAAWQLGVRGLLVGWVGGWVCVCACVCVGGGGLCGECGEGLGTSQQRRKGNSESKKCDYLPLSWARRQATACADGRGGRLGCSILVLAPRGPHSLLAGPWTVPGRGRAGGCALPEACVAQRK